MAANGSEWYIAVKGRTLQHNGERYGFGDTIPDKCAPKLEGFVKQRPAGVGGKKEDPDPPGSQDNPQGKPPENPSTGDDSGEAPAKTADGGDDGAQDGPGKGAGDDPGDGDGGDQGEGKGTRPDDPKMGVPPSVLTPMGLAPQDLKSPKKPGFGRGGYRRS